MTKQEKTPDFVVNDNFCELLPIPENLTEKIENLKKNIKFLEEKCYFNQITINYNFKYNFLSIKELDQNLNDRLLMKKQIKNLKKQLNRLLKLDKINHSIINKFNI